MLTSRLLAYGELANEDVRHITRVWNVLPVMEPGRSIAREGDDLRAVYLVRRGWIARCIEDGSEGGRVVALLLPGDIFDPGMVGMGRADHGIRTLTSVQLAEIEMHDFEYLLRYNPRISFAVRLNAAVAAAVQRRWTYNIARLGALQRVAHLLCEIYCRMQIMGLIVSDFGKMPVTQYDLASACGLTSGYVNRALRTLREDGIIWLERREMRMRDFERLKKLASFDPSYLRVKGG